MTDLNSHYSIAEEQAKKYQEKPLIHNSMYKSELKFINIYISTIIIIILNS